ncbi:MAG: hypothetical protein ACFFDO_02285 [Candidatus Thorarchaeota archaeon]
MSDEKPKKPKLRGFAAFINNIINSVKDKEKCKDIIKGIRTRVLLNNEEDKWAALITVEMDQITVEGIRTEPKENLSRKRLYWWGYWKFPTMQTLMSAANWGTGKWLRKIAGGKIKGASQVAIIGQILAIAAPSASSEKEK